MNCTLAHLQDIFERGTADKGLIRLYGKPAVSSQKERYRLLLDEAEQRLTGNLFFIASAPGRTELGGNHTDHNNGRVLASAVDLDSIGVVSQTENFNITVYSADYPDQIVVELEQLSPDRQEHGSPQSLIRGIAAAREESGRGIGGFSCVVHSTCKPGTGLSSSASFAVLIAGIMATLFDDGPPDPVQLARDSQFTENNFFGKPCGLMDQLSSSAGYTLGIDFNDPEKPEITKISTRFDDAGYRLVIIDTGGSHINLTAGYAAVPEEIARATKVMGKDKARGISLDTILENITAIREAAGDRAVLCLLHFISEDERAAGQTTALLNNDHAEFIKLVKQSGDSSCQLLQNCNSSVNTREQGILLARAVTAQFFPEAVCRVHGGGFAETVQAYVPNELFNDYQLLMEQVFGAGSVIPIVTGRPGFCICAENGWVLPAD